MATRMWKTSQLNEVVALTRGQEHFDVKRTNETCRVRDTSKNKDVLTALRNGSIWIVRYDEQTFQ